MTHISEKTTSCDDSRICLECGQPGTALIHNRWGGAVHKYRPREDKQWVVHWRSSRTDRTGVGDQRFTKEGAEQWAAELNAKPINRYLHHWAEEVKD